MLHRQHESFASETEMITNAGVFDWFYRVNVTAYAFPQDRKFIGPHLLRRIASPLSSCSKDPRRELRIEDIDEPKVQLSLRRKKETLETGSSNGVISLVTGTLLPHPT